MLVLNCLIVEDEPLAAELVKDYIEQIPGLRLMAICGDVFCATEVLRNEKIDIIFLDINLPKVTGIDFIKSMKEKCHVILTTAYHEFAIEGFNLNVTDYLLKPIEFSRFLQAVNKVYHDKKEIDMPTGSEVTQRKFHFFVVDKKQVKIFFDEVSYIESLKDYVRIHSQDKGIVTKFQIGELERIFDQNIFIRIHKSFIVNLQKITAYTANEIEIEGVTLPIGRTYKEFVESRLRKYK